VEHVYRDTFATYGVDVPVEKIRHAVRVTWAEVRESRERGEERWGAADGETGFWRRFVGRIFGRVGGHDLPEPLLRGLVDHFHEEKHWKAYPETRDVLAALREAGMTLLVVSNWDSTLPGLFERLGLAPFFDGFVVSATFGASKPSRAIFDEAVRRAGVPHDQALHVGDSLEEDYLGARAAGLHALLVDREGRHGPDIETITSLRDVPLRLGQR
jgi:putative hydrolase of the HAD superfamily